MGPVLYRDVHLLDLETDTGMTARCDLLTQNGRIAAIGQQLAPPDGAEVVEGRGHLLMPGLVNAHFHSSVNHMKGRLPCLPLELFMLYESPAPAPLSKPPRDPVHPQGRTPRRGNKPYRIAPSSGLCFD